MRNRVLILPISAVIIAALCAYRIGNINSSAPRPIPPTGLRRPAPLFELYNSKKPSETIRLQSYIGRHRILVLFFDGKSGAGQDPTLDRLRREFERIEAADVRIFAVSTALPQENRKVIEQIGPFPFPLLSDPAGTIHRQWGLDPNNPTGTTQAVFLIDRAGNVESDELTPRPLSDADQVIDRIVAES